MFYSENAPLDQKIMCFFIQNKSMVKALSLMHQIATTIW